MTVTQQCREIVVGPNFIAAQPGYSLAMAVRIAPDAPFDIVETPIIGWNVVSRICPECRTIDDDVSPVTVMPIDEQQPYYIIKQPDGHYLVEGEHMFATRDELIKWLNHSDDAASALAAFIDSLGGVRATNKPSKKKARSD